MGTRVQPGGTVSKTTYDRGAPNNSSAASARSIHRIKQGGKRYVRRVCAPGNAGGDSYQARSAKGDMSPNQG
jgi:hypothetical protein